MTVGGRELAYHATWDEKLSIWQVSFAAHCF
jgi:hypothetical protein